MLVALAAAAAAVAMGHYVTCKTGSVHGHYTHRPIGVR